MNESPVQPTIRRIEMRISPGKTEKVYVHHMNGEDFVLLDDLLKLLGARAEEEIRVEEQSSDQYATKEIILNNKRINVYVVNGIVYLTMSQIGELWGYSSSGLTQRLSRLERERKKELEKQREDELQTTGQSAIDPERDAKLRVKFNFSTRSTFMKYEDVLKYFFAPTDHQ